jgi:hypothetical protein
MRKLRDPLNDTSVPPEAVHVLGQHVLLNATMSVCKSMAAGAPASLETLRAAVDAEMIVARAAALDTVEATRRALHAFLESSVAKSEVLDALIEQAEILKEADALKEQQRKARQSSAN